MHSLDSPLLFDYQASTPCDPEVLEAMKPYWNDFWGNPSNRNHRFGLHASAAVDLARDQLSSCLKTLPERMVFTSGATEANNLALLGYARAFSRRFRRKGHLITLTTEHHSVLSPLRQLKKEGFRVTELKPESDGIVSLQKLLHSFEKDTFMVSIMLANNEIGVLQPLQEISRICHEKNVIIHSDIAQAFGNIPVDPDRLGIDLFTISGHKIYGPKGIGVLVKKPDILIQPILFGGDQESGIRPGTLPVPLIIGLAKAAEIVSLDIDKSQKEIRSLRDLLWKGLKEQMPELILNGSLDYRLPNNLNFTIKDVNGGELYSKLRRQIICSSSSACTNGATSHVLASLGRSPQEAAASIRLSIGRSTTLVDVENAIERLVKVIQDLRK